MKVNQYDRSGKLKGQAELPEAVFGAKVSPAAIHAVVRAELANRRQGTHKIKVRDEVSGGGKKPWRQKGTGNARQGSTRAPQWRGGGIVHGPQPRSYRMEVPQQIRQAGLRGVLSKKAESGAISVLEDVQVEGYSTRAVAEVFKAMGLVKEPSVAWIVGSDDAKLRASARNIGNLHLIHASRLNAPEILYSGAVVITQSALRILSETLGKSGSGRAA
ncbi:MAG: 50S ribosomal protein L4 [Leptospirales bacterium]|nr:50S ribosomal protein L4 [Leptospirales bacterium]